MVVNDRNNPGVGRLQRRRLILVVAVAGLWTGLLLGRLGHLQIVLHDNLVERAREQYQYEVDIPATRGQIFARDGSLLAGSIEGRAIYVHPHLLVDPDGAAEALAAPLQMSVEEVTRLLHRTEHLVYLRKFAPPDIVNAVLAVRRARGLHTSLGTHEASRRYYPNRQLAAHVLGFVDSENSGAAGIEYSMDKEIRGQDGR